jgi:AraC-like DNA-binding protein
MKETVRFRPEAVRWWSALMGVSARLGRVHRWQAQGHGPGAELSGLEQHPTVTVVLCLAGVARIEAADIRVDLRDGDALVIQPGTWHRHAPLRPNCLLYRQGIFAGRSDFVFEDQELTLVASWPEHPASELLAALGDTNDEIERVRRLRALLAHLASESAEPLGSNHPAMLAMEYALYQNLHRSDCVERVVAAAGVSRAQAYRLCRTRWGCGIATVVRQARLDLARHLLRDGLPIGEAARRCGIRDRTVFTRAVRRAWGVSPSEWRTATP